MRVELYQRHLKELRDRFRQVHEANLAQLQKAILQDADNKKAVQQKPQTHSIDVRA